MIADDGNGDDDDDDDDGNFCYFDGNNSNANNKKCRTKKLSDIVFFIDGGVEFSNFLSAHLIAFMNTNIYNLFRITCMA